MAETITTTTTTTARATATTTGPYGLTSNWPVALDIAGSDAPCRLEGEICDLEVLGAVPPSIRGTFYRVMCDPFVAPHPGNVPLDGDGTVSAFRILDGRVDFRLRYVETERYKLERRARARLFGLYRNPFTHHPCVRAAVDSTANTNLVLWAGHLLALKEGGLPYALDPDTLATRGHDPFAGTTPRAKTFTAHPKRDPFTGELVVFGYEAKGLASRDVVLYHLDAGGAARDVRWIKTPWCAPIHDCAVTPNWVVLVLWPFEASVERMKRGGHHWAWNYDRPATFVVVPRRKSTRLPKGWRDDETHRTYHWRNCMPIHTGGAWEEETDDGVRLLLESSRVHDNAFPFFPPDDGRMPAPDARADFVRWTLDPALPSGTRVADPLVVLDVPSEFPRVDERFLTRRPGVTFLNVFVPDDNINNQDGVIFHGLNGLAMHDDRTNRTVYFRAEGEGSLVQEPAFVPRAPDSPEGDGWVLAMVERRAENRNELVVLDTRDFANPVAVVRMPFRMKAQIHGNWVPAEELPEGGGRSIVREIPVFEVSRGGALEPLEGEKEEEKGLRVLPVL